MEVDTEGLTDRRLMTKETELYHSTEMEESDTEDEPIDYTKIKLRTEEVDEEPGPKKSNESGSLNELR